ncbi:hypothetical protein H4Q26_011335 [Puccinia striiformis f. sp. tritici PST-130]|nr:hypothetical protein H4Q26_011335 [Puccinia striiformis f. sp. tritici PST-130]
MSLAQWQLAVTGCDSIVQVLDNRARVSLRWKTKEWWSTQLAVISRDDQASMMVKKPELQPVFAPKSLRFPWVISNPSTNGQQGKIDTPAGGGDSAVMQFRKGDRWPETELNSSTSLEIGSQLPGSSSKPTDSTVSRCQSEPAEIAPEQLTAETVPAVPTEVHRSDNISSQSDRNVAGSGVDSVDRTSADGEIENKHLKKVNELQRQEIIKLRYELAESLHGPNSRTEPGIKSSLAQKRPHSMVDPSADAQKNKGKNKKSTRGKKMVRFDDPKKDASVDGLPSETPLASVSAGNSSFDTLSRVIRLNQLLRSPSSDHLQTSIQIDLLTLEAIREASESLLMTLHNSIQELSQKVFEKQSLTVTTIQRAVHLVTQSIKSVLGPLLLPDTLSLPSSSNHEAMKERWGKVILPYIYQHIESLFEKMISIVILSCERLDECFSEDSRTKPEESFEAENTLVLREELQRSAVDLIRQSSTWTGNVQFQLIKMILDKIENIYFTSDHQTRDLEALGFLAELLENFSHYRSMSSLNEHNLSEIRARIGKIFCNQKYGICGLSNSSIIDRKLDRILMQFWL